MPFQRFLLVAVTAIGLAALTGFDGLDNGSQSPGFFHAASAGPAVSEKEAFEAAKELGTIEAWEAFLTRFSTGFRADLARAYLKRIGTSKPAATPAAKPGAQPAQAQPSKAAAPRSPPLATHSSRASSSPWRTTRYRLDEGNASAPAAAVSSNGVEFLLYCNQDKRLAAILRESDRGRYPDFNARIRQGLEAKQGRRGNAAVPIEFSGGSRYPVSAALEELTGEVRLGFRARGGGFRADGDFISEMMSGNTFNIFAPPFDATLQLTGSRKAICNVADKCGVSASGCGGSKAYTAPATKKKSYTKKKKKKKTQSCKKSGGKCSRNSQCCSGKCCLDDFEECEGWYGKCG